MKGICLCVIVTQYMTCVVTASTSATTTINNTTATTTTTTEVTSSSTTSTTPTTMTTTTTTSTTTTSPTTTTTLSTMGQGGGDSTTPPPTTAQTATMLSTTGDTARPGADDQWEGPVSTMLLIRLISPLYALLLIILVTLCCCFCCRLPRDTARRVRKSVAEIVARRSLTAVKVDEAGRNHAGVSSHVYDDPEGGGEEFYLHPVSTGAANVSPSQQKKKSPAPKYPSLGPSALDMDPLQAPTPAARTKTATQIADGDSNPREEGRELVEGGNNNIAQQYTARGPAEGGEGNPLTDDRGPTEGADDAPTAVRGFGVRHGLHHMEASSAATAMARCVLQAAAVRAAAHDQDGSPKPAVNNSAKKPLTPTPQRRGDVTMSSKPAVKTQHEGLKPTPREEDEEEILPLHGATEDEKRAPSADSHPNESVLSPEISTQKKVPEPDFDDAT
ncbi:mucin-2-like isoform X2 [Littorina saxatilis]|uniref:mucin-2-like isoform X2 n=1 Tax=Littorina saxatilis TaxID=31220 RepID=UPI0038B4A7C7